MKNYKTFPVKAAVISSLVLACSSALAKDSKSPFSEGPYNPSEHALTACPEYGSNYYRIGNTGSCFRIGGSIRVESVQRSTKTKSKPTGIKNKSHQSSRRSSAYAEFELISQTDFGPARIVVRKHGDF